MTSTDRTAVHDAAEQAMAADDVVENNTVKSRLNVLRNLGIGVRIWSLVGLSVIALVAFGGVAALSQFKSEQHQKTLNAYVSISFLTEKMEIAALQMRRSEKDFLLRDDPKYRDKYLKAEKEGQSTLGELRQIPEAQPIGGALQSLSDGFGKHAAQFATVFGLKEKLGFDEKSGLQGSLRKAVHGVETRLNEAKLDNLTVKMLMMRRHEKDFIMRGDPKYIDRIDKRQAEFKTLLAGSTLPPDEQKAIGDLLDRYVADFKAFAETSLALIPETKKLSTIFAEMDPSFGKVLKFAESSGHAARAANKESTHSLNLMMIGLAVVILMVCLTAGYFIARSILRPMAALTGATARLADGETDIVIEGAEYRDETGEMASALEVFRTKLIENDRLQAEQREAEKRKREDDARQAEEKRAVEAKAEEDKRAADADAERQRKQAMLDMANEFERSVMGIVDALSAATTEMQSSAQNMLASAEQTSRQATTVSAASEEATTNVQTVASATEELSASIAEISRQVTQSNQISQNAVEEAKQTNAKVEGLAEAAQKIGDVVSLINDIASQTNLLALNATIEAARAGEAGKGFAVVASEVKSLATQTGKATEEIGAQITAIQSATNDAVQAIQGIGSTIGQMGEIATSVASAVEEQGAATREIATNVQQAAAGTQDVSSNIIEVTQAADESRNVSGQMLDAATELAQQGDVLRREVGKFLESVRAA